MASVATHCRQGRIRARQPTPSLTLAPLGVPLDVELVASDAADVVAIACERWRGVPTAMTSLALRIEASEGSEHAGDIVIEIDGAAMHLRGGVDGTADPALGQAKCRVPPRYLASPDLLRAEVLEPLVLHLLGRNDRAPVHASCFLADDLAILLGGPSGSGKSCLALAADAAGFPVLSEDVTYVQLCPRLTVWGWPGPVHLLPSDTPPGESFATRVRNGKTKLAVPLETPGSAAMSDARAAFCLLERGNTVSLDRLSPEAAMNRLAHLEPGFDTLVGEVRAAHAALTRDGAWQLTLSADPAEAIRFIAANLARLRDAAVP